MDSGSPSTERYRAAAERDRGEWSIACQRRLASRMSAADAPSSRRASSTRPGLWSAMRRSSTSWKSRGVKGAAGRFPVGMGTIIGAQSASVRAHAHCRGKHDMSSLCS